MRQIVFAAGAPQSARGPRCGSLYSALPDPPSWICERGIGKGNRKGYGGKGDRREGKERDEKGEGQWKLGECASLASTLLRGNYFSVG